jgi:hypothetical protein
MVLSIANSGDRSGGAANRCERLSEGTRGSGVTACPVDAWPVAVADSRLWAHAGHQPSCSYILFGFQPRIPTSGSIPAELHVDTLFREGS